MNGVPTAVVILFLAITAQAGTAYGPAVAGTAGLSTTPRVLPAGNGNYTTQERGALQGSLPSAVCIQRYEDNGVLNVLSSEVSVTYPGNGAPAYSAWIGGGQAVCFFVFPGKLAVKANSYRLWDPHSKNPHACKSNALLIDVPEHRRVFVTVEPTGAASGKCWKITR